jgi:hypothetical protein
MRDNVESDIEDDVDKNHVSSKSFIEEIVP